MTRHAGKKSRLTPARRRLLDREFSRLVDLPAAQRTSELARLAKRHPRIADWLSRLLAAMEQAEDHLQDPLGRLAGDLARLHAKALFELPPGARLGAWRVIEPIGRGGMGLVYRVERADGAFDMTAAAKLIHLRVDAQLEMRLALERQLLARLDHPNIARILDGGTSADGQPFLVMEWVPGQDLSEHDRVLTQDQRLDLFMALADAVAHAHQRSVVHGDIKPANVRLGADGRVRLLDFGVARLVLAEQGDEGEPVKALTPAFAAPEQLRGQPPSTQSDVWALGALLGWLLMGGRYDRARLRSDSALEQALGEGLVRSRDLLAILRRACAENPDDRYAGVSELIEDLKRYRQCRPVRARTPTRAYLLDRFVRRHPVRVSLTTLSILLLLFGLGGVSWQAHIAGLERDRAERQRDRAELHAATTEQVSEFLVGLFEQADPFLSPGNELSVRDLLDQGRARIAALDEAPLVQAEMHQVLARVHRSLADHASAHQLSARAIELLESQQDVDDARLAAAWTVHAGTLASLGRYAEAEQAHRQALALTDPQDYPAVAARLNNLGLAAFSLGRLAEAESLLETALALRQADQPDSADTAASYNNLALVLAALDRRQEAEPLYRRALEIRRVTLGEEHPTTTFSMTNLATLLSQLERWEEAESAYLEALYLRRRIFGEQHPAVASVLYQIGWLKAQRGEPAAAEKYLGQALEIREQVLGADHPSTAVVLNAAADVARELGDLARAEDWLRRALTIYRDVYGASHHDIALVLANLGLTRAAAGALDNAADLLEQALEMNRQELGPVHRHVADNLRSLAQVRLQQGQQTLAAEHAQAAIEVLAALGRNDSHPEIVELRQLLPAER